MKRYQLPPRFYWDHRERDLPELGTSRVVSETRRHVVIDMDAAAYADLRSDADYYSDAATASQMQMPGLAASARATLRILDQLGAP